MNSDADELKQKRKATARIVCLVAAVFVLIPCLGLKWMKATGGREGGISLLFVEPGGRGKSMSNLDVADQYNKMVEEYNEMVGSARAMGETGLPPAKDTIMGTFAYAGIATIFFSLISVGALIAAGVLAFKDKFIRSPISLTTVALIGLCLALVFGCIFLGAIPSELRKGIGVGWPFFMFGAGVVAGIAGAQMLAKAYAETHDPYWDGQV